MKRGLVRGPVMQGGWIEVRSIGPYQRVDFMIDANAAEDFQIA